MNGEKWLKKYLELPYGVRTDDTYRLVLSNIDASHFFQVTVSLLLQTVDGILRLAGNENELHKERIVSVDGKESCGSKRKSIEADVELFERAARGHWGIEVNLRWHLDFTFRDDKNRGMEKIEAKNLQIMEKIVLSILSLVKESYKMSMKRIRYELSLNYEIDSIKHVIEWKRKSPGK